METVSVLVEFNNSKRPVVATPRTLLDEISLEIKKIDPSVVIVLDYNERQGRPVLLQRYSTLWSEYIDVLDPMEIDDGDRLRIIPFPKERTSPTSKDGQLHTAKAEGILSKISYPNESDARSLSKLFPASLPCSSKKRAFDPMADCVVLPQQKKRKAAFRSKAERWCSVTVVMLDKYVPTIPKGKVRQDLARKGRIKTLKVKRSMSPEDISNLVARSFRIESYTVLECDSSGHNLMKADNQEITGDATIGRRGCLYLCETFEDSVGPSHISYHNKMRALPTQMESDDSDFEEQTLQKGKVLSYKEHGDSLHYRGKGKEKAPASSHHDFIDLSPPSDDDERETARRECVAETRKIREEQDRAYEESLIVDRQKKKARNDEARREELRQLLKAKWTKVDYADGLRFSIRFPNSSKLTCSVPQNAASKAIYEIAYAFGDVNGPFGVYTLRPRVSIPCDNSPLHTTMEDTPTVLVVEESDVHRDPLEWSSESDGMGVRENLVEHTSADWEFLKQVDASRLKYMIDALDTHQGLPHCIRRSCVFDDCVELYQNSLQDILHEFPFRVRYVQERAVDTGGVSRDLFSAFWELAFSKLFDGGGSLIPAVHAQINMSMFTVLGSILAHGFMSSGFLPVRIVFPVIASVVLGPEVTIPDEIMLDSIMDYVSIHERTIFKEALDLVSKSCSQFTSMVPNLVDVLSRLGCRHIPTVSNIQQLLIDVARYEFSVKTLAATHAMRAGVPAIYYNFWNKFTITELFNMYKALSATPSSVIRMIHEPVALNAAEERVYGYLINFVGNMKLEELRLFLRFITGSSVCIDKKIEISFNNISGVARRPIAHTCSCVLELPISYSTYPEFSEEFSTILTSQLSWAMDGV